MTDLLDRDNKHIFLEKPNNTSNSFIANLNKVAAKLDEVKSFNDRFTDEQLAVFHKLNVDSLIEDLEYIAKDLAKGTYNGLRKLDIDLLTNFLDYDPSMTDEEKLALWNNVDKQVYYNKAIVTFTDYSTAERTFDTVVSNHRQLFDQFEDWKDESNSTLAENMGATGFNITPSDPLYEHELLRFYDSEISGATKGSLIVSIQLCVDTTAYCAISEVNSRVKSLEPIFTWADTTSSLVTLANSMQEILRIAEFFESMDYDYLNQLQELADEIETLTQQVQDDVDAAIEAAEVATSIRDKYENLTVISTPVDVDEDPSVSYDSNTNSFNFNLPRNGYFVVGISDFILNSETGHLSFVTFEDDDVESIVIDDATGKIIVTVNNG